MTDPVENILAALFLLALIFSMLPPEESRSAAYERKCFDLVVSEKVHSWKGCRPYLDRHPGQ